MSKRGTAQPPRGGTAATTRRPSRRGAGRRPTARLTRGFPFGSAVVWLMVAGIAAGLLALFLVLRDGGGGADGGSPSTAFVGGDLHSLASDPASGRLYVGGHQGVAVSTDGGRTWRQVSSLEGADAMGWAFTEERVLVGGHPGLYVSEDGGRTFGQRNEGLPATDIHALGAGDGVIYAASPAAGVFASTDGGAIWEMRTEQAGQSFMGRIVVDPGDPEHLVAPDMANGVVESTDGGQTWSVLTPLPGVMWVTWDATDPERLIATSMSAAMESTDGGQTWEQVVVPDGVSIVEMDSRTPETLYAAALEGEEAAAWVSLDGGRTWDRP